MLHEFLPAIVSVAIMVGVFAFACVSDLRRISRLQTPAAIPDVATPTEGIGTVEAAQAS